MSEKNNFWNEILEGIPTLLPECRPRSSQVSHAPNRKQILNKTEKCLALKNALRYFKKEHHEALGKEFLEELETFGRIYMYRFRPTSEIFARPLHEYKAKSKSAAAIMLMIQNNLDEKVAQHPEELITYGGNGAVFQNWAQYRLTMKYLAEMSDEQTLTMYSGHPMGLFPSHEFAPRVVVTNGLMIPNYSSQDDLEKFSALGVTQYGQMTAGSYMYIGPQGIVHGTTLTLLNAGRKFLKTHSNLSGKLFISSGLGGMSGAQAKASKICGAVGVIAEVNEEVVKKRHTQGWVDEIFYDLDLLIKRVRDALEKKEARSIAYVGNIVLLFEKCLKENLKIDLGSDQTSLHNPYSGGYYPADLSYLESVKMISENPKTFENHVKKSLKRHVDVVDKLTEKGMYFFDYGNAFLLEASRAGADIIKADGEFKYPSYVQDILGPLCFDYGFGPFRWVCTSGLQSDLDLTDKIAYEVLQKLLLNAPEEIKGQISDNIEWIKNAKDNELVVGSKARILYADCDGRIEISRAFNEAIKNGKISAPIVLGRDHHDVSGTDSPYRETSNIVDGSKFTADMSVQNFVGDAMRGASWVSLHNGGGVGFGEVMNGGFGLVIDGSDLSIKRLESMLFCDVNNGISRRAWAQNKEAKFAIHRESLRSKLLNVTESHEADVDFLKSLF